MLSIYEHLLCFKCSFFSLELINFISIDNRVWQVANEIPVNLLLSGHELGEADCSLLLSGLPLEQVPHSETVQNFTLALTEEGLPVPPANEVWFSTSQWGV